MKYLKKFSTHTEYEEARQNLILPNVSLCAQENEVHYNPISEKGLFWMEVNDGTNNYFWLVNESGSIISANLGSGFLGVKKDEFGNFEVTFADEFCNLYEVEDGTVGQGTLDFTYDGVDYHIDTAQSTITPNVTETIPLVTKCEPVDLGLPSGTKWGSTNLLASSQTDLGKIYSFNDLSESGTTISRAAPTILGGRWENPLKSQIEELINNTTHEWVDNFEGSGRKGMKFTGTNGNFIFVPGAYYWDRENYEPIQPAPFKPVDFAPYAGVPYDYDSEYEDYALTAFGIYNTTSGQAFRDDTFLMHPGDVERCGLGLLIRPVFLTN